MRAFFNRIKFFLLRHQFAVSVTGFVLLGFMFLIPEPASASCGISQLGDCVIGFFSYIIGDLLVPFFGKIMALLTEGIVYVAGYNDFGSATAVQVGWVLTRDIANMFFVIALLLMAFGTMLNVEKLGTLHHLPHVVMYAIAVNFSKTIVLFVIDIAQVFMLTFVSAFQNTAAGNFVKAFGITDWFTLVGESSSNGSGGVVGAALAGMLLALALVVIAVVVLAIFLGYLVHRMVYLWVLIILAPLAFGAAALGEKGHHQYAHWWKELVETIIAGPVLAFFLWLTLLIAGSSVGGSIGAEVMSGSVATNFEKTQGISAVEGGQEVQSKAFSPDTLLTFFISIMLLIIGLHLTEEISGGAFKGGKAMTKKVGGYAGKYGWAASKFAAKYGAKGTVAAVRAIPLSQSVTDPETGEKTRVRTNVGARWDAEKLAKDDKKTNKENKKKEMQVNALRAMGQHDAANRMEAELVTAHQGKFAKNTGAERETKLKAMRDAGKTNSLEYKALAMAMAEGGDFVNGDAKLDQVAGLDAKLKKELVKKSNASGGNYTSVPDGGSAEDAIKTAMAAGDTHKLFSNIDSGVKMTRDLDGKEVMADKTAVQKLMAMDSATFNSPRTQPAMKEKIRKALLLGMKNTKGAERDQLLAKFNELTGATGAGAHTVDASGTISDAALAETQNKVFTTQQSGLAGSYTKETRKEKGNISKVDRAMGDSLRGLDSGTARSAAQADLGNLTRSVSAPRLATASSTTVDAQEKALADLQRNLRIKYASSTKPTGLVDESGNEMKQADLFDASTLNKTINDMREAMRRRATLANDHLSAAGNPAAERAVEKQIEDTEKYIATLNAQMGSLARDTSTGRSASAGNRAGYEAASRRNKFSDARVKAAMSNVTSAPNVGEKKRAMQVAHKEMEETLKRFESNSVAKTLDPTAKAQLTAFQTSIRALGKDVAKNGPTPTSVAELERLNKEYENLRRNLS